MVEILDEKTKKEIKSVMKDEMKEFKKGWDKEMKGAKKAAGKKVKELEKEWDVNAEEYVESIKEKPVEWVAGAFVAGLLLGGLLRK